MRSAHGMAARPSNRLHWRDPAQSQPRRRLAQPMRRPAVEERDPPAIARDAPRPPVACPPMERRPGSAATVPASTTLRFKSWDARSCTSPASSVSASATRSGSRSAATRPATRRAHDRARVRSASSARGFVAWLVLRGAARAGLTAPRLRAGGPRPRRWSVARRVSACAIGLGDPDPAAACTSSQRAARRRRRPQRRDGRQARGARVGVAGSSRRCARSCCSGACCSAPCSRRFSDGWPSVCRRSCSRWRTRCSSPTRDVRRRARPVRSRAWFRASLAVRTRRPVASILLHIGFNLLAVVAALARLTAPTPHRFSPAQPERRKTLAHFSFGAMRKSSIVREARNAQLHRMCEDVADHDPYADRRARGRVPPLPECESNSGRTTPARAEPRRGPGARRARRAEPRFRRSAETGFRRCR